MKIDRKYIIENMASKANVRKEAYDFIMANRAASLATVSEGNLPHVAIVYCITKEDLSLYFMTRVEARKFANIVYQPIVAMSITDEKHLQTIQLTGTAERVDNLSQELAIWHELMLFRLPNKDQKPVPSIQLFESGSTNELAIIKVTPAEMTFADFDIQPDGRYKSFFRKVI